MEETLQTVVLFPGQGSQAVGMLRATKDLPAVRQMLATANDVLGYDLLQVCLGGPEEKLNDTAFSQPAIFVGNLAAVERLRSEEPAALASVSAAAGLSLGEYSALVFAGAMSFEDGLSVVKARAESMAAAASEGKHGMLAVVGLDDAALEGCIRDALRGRPEGTVCQCANMLFSKGRTIAGDKDALVALEPLLRARGASVVQTLTVSGAFHTHLMEPAAAALRDALAKVEVRSTRIPVVSNVTGEPFPGDGGEIRALLERQLVSVVQWEGTVEARGGEPSRLTRAVRDSASRYPLLQGLLRLPGPPVRLHEVGPGQVLKGMVRFANKSAWAAMRTTEC